MTCVTDRFKRHHGRPEVAKSGYKCRRRHRSTGRTRDRDSSVTCSVPNKSNLRKPDLSSKPISNANTILL